MFAPIFLFVNINFSRANFPVRINYWSYAPWLIKFYALLGASWL